MVKSVKVALHRYELLTHLANRFFLSANRQIIPKHRALEPNPFVSSGDRRQKPKASAIDCLVLFVSSWISRFRCSETVVIEDPERGLSSIGNYPLSKRLDQFYAI